MNATRDQKTTLAEALLAEPASLEAPWAKAARDAARERFLTLGAPIKRDEYWKYTDPARLTEPMTAAAAVDGVTPAASEAFSQAGAKTLVFVNGRFQPALSDAIALEGIEVTPLSTISGADGAGGWAIEALGSLEAEMQSPAPRPMAALAGALFTDGVAIRVTGTVETPIHIRYAAVGQGAAHVRHVVEVAPGASATLLESGVLGHRSNSALEVTVADKGAFHHVRLQTEAEAQQCVTALFGRVGAEAELKSFTLSTALAGVERLVRNELMVSLEGDGGTATVAGGLLGQSASHIDNTVFLTHDAVGCESRQVYKTVLDDRSRGVFQGKILVREGAQQTDGYQISQAVLLGAETEFDAKPELEIYADDVKCSHGSTSGALDPESLFYLRARGVDEKTAQTLLVGAFLEEAVDEIDAEPLQEAVRAEIAAWMAARGA